MKRLPVVLLPVLLLAALVIGGYLWHLGDLARVPDRVSVLSQSNAPVPIGGPFALVDQNGKRRTDKDFRGKYMLVYFGYTYCPDVCPTTLAMMAATLSRLGPLADRIAPLFISVDPKRDTPAVLKTYLSVFSPRFIGLTGTPKQIAAAAKAYRVYYKAHPQKDGSYTIDHSSIIYLMDPKGRYLAHYSLDVAPDQMAKDLTRLIAGTD